MVDRRSQRWPLDGCHHHRANGSGPPDGDVVIATGDDRQRRLSVGAHQGAVQVEDVGRWCSPVPIAVDEAHGAPAGQHIGPTAVLENEALEGPAVGEPGVASCVAGDRGRQVPDDHGRQGNGQRLQPAHGLAKPSGRASPFGGQPGEEAEPPDLLPGRDLVGEGGQPDEHEVPDELRETGGQGGSDDPTGRMADDHHRFVDQRQQVPNVTIDVVGGVGRCRRTAEAQEVGRKNATGLPSRRPCVYS